MHSRLTKTASAVDVISLAAATLPACTDNSGGSQDAPSVEPAKTHESPWVNWGEGVYVIELNKLVDPKAEWNRDDSPEAFARAIVQFRKEHPELVITAISDRQREGGYSYIGMMIVTEQR